MSIKVTRKGPSLEDIIKSMDTMSKEYVAIGLFSKGAGNDYDKNLALRMAVFEAGSINGNMLPRPVFQTTMADRKVEVKQYMKFLYGEMLKGNMSRKEIYNLLGKRYTQYLKDQFLRRTFAALKPSYKVRPSGRAVTPNSTPLLDTNKMRSSITHKVVM